MKSRTQKTRGKRPRVVKVTLPSWKIRCKKAMGVAAGRSAKRREYVEANVNFVFEAVNGCNSFSSAPDPSAGVHAVANISSVHIPAFVHASLTGNAKPYKNGYDLGRHHYRVGDS